MICNRSPLPAPPSKKGRGKERPSHCREIRRSPPLPPRMGKDGMGVNGYDDFKALRSERVTLDGDYAAAVAKAVEQGIDHVFGSEDIVPVVEGKI